MMNDSDEAFIYPKHSTKAKSETKTKENANYIKKKLNLSLNLKIKRKIVSTPELSLHEMKVKQNLEIE